MKSICAISVALAFTLGCNGTRQQVANCAAPSETPTAVTVKPKNPHIVLIIESPSRSDAFANYWDKDGVERGAHISCPTAQATQAASGLNHLSDVIHLFKGPDAKAAADLFKGTDPEQGACTVAKRSWHYSYGDSGQLVKVEGDSKVGDTNIN